METIDRRRLLGGVLNGEVVERVVEAGGRRPCAQEGDAMKIAACLAALGTVILVLVSCLAPARASEIDQRCGVFARASDKANCACALQHGGWVTQASGTWRWIYPTRHQERHCHGLAHKHGTHEKW